MVEILIALLISLFGTANVTAIDRTQFYNAVEEAGIECENCLELLQRPIPGNGQDLLSPGQIGSDPEFKE